MSDEPAKTLRELRQRILEACNAELVAVLAKHGCALRAVPFIADGRIDARLDLVVKE